MKVRKISLICLLFGLILLAGCGKNSSNEAKGTVVYYTNMNGTALEKEEYDLSEGQIEDEIQAILDKMASEPESIEYKSAFPENVKVKSWEFKNGKLSIDFNKAYGKMDSTSELLLRAALVQTFTQIEEIAYVEISVDSKPLTDESGTEIGAMGSEFFVQNTGSSLHSTQVGELKLYFVNEEGDMLGEEQRKVRYNSNMSIERLIIEELMDGPDVGTSQVTVSESCKVLGVSVKDGICYINFDESFLEAIYPFEPKLTIYSMVNSVVENGSANQVQFLVNGETNVKYYQSVDLSKPFSRNLDIVEKETD